VWGGGGGGGGGAGGVGVGALPSLNPLTEGKVERKSGAWRQAEPQVRGVTIKGG